jgi:Rrf2 family protein
MQLRNQVEWALHCCAILVAVPEGRYLPTKALAEFHGVPKEYLSKALQNLSQAGIVEGTLGPGGGYRLAKPVNEISFLDIVEAVEGSASTFACSQIRFNNPCLPHDAAKSAHAKKPCAVARVMWEADEAWRTKLRETSLLDLLVTLNQELPAKLAKETFEWVAERS